MNAFAILDDSDDESPPITKPTTTTTKQTSAKPSNSNKNIQKNDRRNNTNPARTNNNDRNTKGGRGPRTARDGKRTYDRRSGTGRGKEIKKGGGGSRNWGSDKAEAKKAEGALPENKEPTTTPDQDAVAVPEPAPTPVVEQEPEQVTMSLEEYLESKKTAGESVFGTRKVKTIEDNEFAGKQAHAAVEGDFMVMGSGKALRTKGAGKKEVQRLDVAFRVASTNTGAGDDDHRGGRGGGRGGDRRGGRGRGGDRRGAGRGGDRRGGERRTGGKRGAGNKNGFALDSDAFPTL
jgi:plasminogen activator inhibitor 1 RNA-binding protein